MSLEAQKLGCCGTEVATERNAEHGPPILEKMSRFHTRSST